MSRAAAVAASLLLALRDWRAARTSRRSTATRSRTTSRSSASARRRRPDGAAEALPIFRDLADEAPDDIRDEWRTVIGALEGLEDALDDAGVDPATYDRDDPPAGLSQDEQDADRRRGPRADQRRRPCRPSTASTAAGPGRVRNAAAGLNGSPPMADSPGRLPRARDRGYVDPHAPSRLVARRTPDRGSAPAHSRTATGGPREGRGLPARTRRGEEPPQERRRLDLRGARRGPEQRGHRQDAGRRPAPVDARVSARSAPGRRWSGSASPRAAGCAAWAPSRSPRSSASSA